MAGKEDVKLWNSFIANLLTAKKDWKSLQELLDTRSLRELQNYPIDAQKHLSKFRRIEFQMMLPMLCDYARGAGGIEELLVKLPEEVKPKEKEEKKEKENASEKD
jgi:hypothetical protein